MLKQLVQLFAEKFLVCKKEWVAEQPAISPGDSIMLSVTADGENHNFTMPCTGYANLFCSGISSEYSFGILSGQIESKLFSNGDSTYLYIPIKKGANVDFYCRAARDNPEILKSLYAKFVKNLGSA